MQEAPDFDEETGQAKVTDMKMVHVTVPVVGESYIAYFTPPPFSTTHPALTDKIPSDQWFRVCVLHTTSCDHSLVLAIDFGFTTTLVCTRLYPLPDQCRGVPPQVSKGKTSEFSIMSVAVGYSMQSTWIDATSIQCHHIGKFCWLDQHPTFYNLIK